MRTTVNPDVAQRMQAANTIVRARLSMWGPMGVMHGTALGLIALGTILPLATVAQFNLFSTSANNVHIFDLGTGGWFVLLLGVVLATAPFVLSLTRQANMAAFGAACCALGSLCVGFAGAKAVALLAQLDFGYYAFTLAFGILAVAYWRRFWNVAKDHPTPLS